MLKQFKIEPFVQDDVSFLGAFAFEKNNRIFLLSNNGFSILIDNNLLQLIQNQNMTEDLMFKLVQHGLADIDSKVLCKKQPDIQVQYFMIDFTKKCNFNCIYCFRDFSQTHSITDDCLYDILIFINEYCEKENITKISIQFWGGEPLFALEQIKKTVEFFNDTSLDVHYDLETNASLVNHNTAQELKDLNISVGVSIDGTAELHNKQRNLVSGKASFDLVKNGIVNLQKFYGEDISGITVVTKYNHQHIKEILDYYIYELKLKTMKFNIVRDNPYAVEENLVLSEKEIASFTKTLIEYIMAYQNMGVNFTEGNIGLRLQNLLYRSGVSCCISNGCKGGKNIVSFNQNGDIFPCEMTDFPDEKIGSIYSDIPLDEQIKGNMKTSCFFNEKKSKQCNSCAWWYYCGGGCSSRNHYLGESSIDKVECCLNKTIYPALIELILDGQLPDYTSVPSVTSILKF